MSHRLLTFLPIALATALATGCAEQPANGGPVIHRPLLYRSYANDVVAPRAPPRFVIEAVRPRRGYAWAHSYYRWNGHDFVMVPGHWEPEQSGNRYIDPHWDRHNDGWHFRPGKWVIL